MTPKLWIDVEDLFEYATGNSRPSGIQRLTLELYASLQQHYGASGLLNFVRHDAVRASYRTVRWSEIAALFTALVDRPDPAASRRDPDPTQPPPPLRRLARELFYRLPADLRAPVGAAVQAQRSSLRAWRTLAGKVSALAAATARNAVRLGRGPDRTDPAYDFESQSGPGDILLVLGAFWSHPDHAGVVTTLKQRQIRFATMVYDLIPLLHPEWCDSGLVQLFRSSFRRVMLNADHIFTISNATASDLVSYAGKHGIPLSAAISTIPIGTGFGAAAAPVNAHTPGRHAPPPGEFVLIVSTIEVRKNHLLLFRLWLRLIEDLPPDQVPTLVFAGRVGWLVSDLMAMIANTDYLGGKLVVLENPTDADLATLYGRCLFTIFPSFFEGWGLPVTESLSFGKPCLVANGTSLPEAGAGLCRMLDPDNLHDAYAALRAVLDDRALLAAWQRDVVANFKPVPWSVTARALLAGLGHPLAATQDGPLARQPQDAK